jgi:predicted DNA-binding protein
LLPPLIGVKKRFSFMIEPDVLDRLRSIKSRTGLSDAEQIREAIRMWLASREWPVRKNTKPPLRDD